VPHEINQFKTESDYADAAAASDIFSDIASVIVSKRAKANEKLLFGKRQNRKELARFR
jgi:hypothetical protein